MLSALSFPRECVVLITNNSFKLAYIKYISKVVHPKYWRGFYKYLLCLKKNSGELLWSAHCTWHQNALLSLPCDMDATIGRICSYPDGELVQMLTGCGNTDLWVQGGVLGTGRLRYSWCQAGGGGESLSQHKLLSLNSWQDTRHFSKVNSSSYEQETVGKGGSDQSWRPCHVSSVLFSQALKDSVLLCRFVCMCVTIYLTWILLFLPF